MNYSKSEKVREAILKTAKKQFYQFGFDNTTIRGIAKEANLNPSLAYYHFKGKYDIAHIIIDEYHLKVKKIFEDEYADSIEDPFLKLLVLYRYGLREIYENDRDLDFYISVYQNSYYDRSLVEEFRQVADCYLSNVSDEQINIVAIATSASWGHLYTDPDIPFNENFSHRVILDAIDVMRWVYLGFERSFVLNKLDESYVLLDKLPHHGLHILNDNVD